MRTTSAFSASPPTDSARSPSIAFTDCLPHASVPSSRSVGDSTVGAAPLSRSAPEACAPAAEIPTRGRPTLYGESISKALCCIIRAEGISDSAAARRLGLDKATISRWKVSHPELELALRRAREQFNDAKLQALLDVAKPEACPNWRAAARLLVHVFPEDYSLNPKRRRKSIESPIESIETHSSDSSNNPIPVFQKLQNPNTPDALNVLRERECPHEPTHPARAKEEGGGKPCHHEPAPKFQKLQKSENPAEPLTVPHTPPSSPAPYSAFQKLQNSNAPAAFNVPRDGECPHEPTSPARAKEEDGGESRHHEPAPKFQKLQNSTTEYLGRAEIIPPP